MNEKLREKGALKSVTVQKICRMSKDEKEVREILEVVWEDAEKGEETLVRVADKNKEVYELEKMLENT